jgi:glycosyltransferase involved in cell wall biosynthesis
MTQRVTVLIPTAGRPRLIEHAFNGLRVQNFTDFEVLLVLRPDDVETIEVVERFRKYLDIRVVFQKRRGLMEAYNEGINSAKGDVIVFLDDDAIPEPNCIREHLLTYERNNVSGVSGDVIPAYLVNDVLNPVESSSEVVGFYRETKILRMIGDKFWNRPLEGQEGYLAYISKAGYSRKNIHLMGQGVVSSLLCMAANMSVLNSALKDFRIPASFLKRGIDFEQVVGWRLWRNGHRMVFNPRAKVYHVRHGQTMSRSHGVKSVSHAIIEDELVFYYLFLEGEKLSKMHRIVSLLYNSLVHVRKVKENRRYETAILRGILFGNIVGLKWLISRKIRGSYVPTQDAMLK